MSAPVQIRRLLTLETALVEVSRLEAAGVWAWCPDIDGYAAYPNLSATSMGGHRIFVFADDVRRAQDVLSEVSPSPDPLYPCPACGGSTRRLRRIILTLAFMLIRQSLYPFPFFRRRRLYPRDGTRHLPEPVEPFSRSELGYEPPSGDLVWMFRALLAYTRSLGYERNDQAKERNDEPSRDL